jgi:imidazolonepropionase-like amidohydrolase
VYFQYERPELAGWNSETVAGLWGILERHFEHIALAAELSVPIVAGSDAGSYGVPHGQGLIDELLFLRRAGLTIEAVLAAATSVPRQRWGCECVDIHPGRRADLIVLTGSPFEDMENLRHVRTVLRGISSLDLGGERLVARAPEALASS